MSRAEEKSEQYRAFREQCGIKDPVMLNEIDEACYEGYLQAEKDLALTVEDIIAIDDLFTEVFKVVDVKTNEYYQEVLKRFNEMKSNQ